ncbi:unnamed protein product, partial [Rotaria sordida]
TNSYSEQQQTVIIPSISHVEHVKPPNRVTKPLTKSFICYSYE